MNHAIHLGCVEMTGSLGDWIESAEVPTDGFHVRQQAMLTHKVLAQIHLSVLR